MLNTKQNFNQLDATLAVKELDNEVAATCSGGAAFLYQDDGFTGRRLRFNEGSDDLGVYGFNDETSSIAITGNRSWVFYPDINNQGRPVTLPPGEYNLSQLRGRRIQNDTISSLRRIDIPASRRII
ncbi:putative alpha-1,6-mannanase, GH76 family [Nostoc flagelliforme CCNUN1]|uniref:Putative alpha-1,6-mannanase, GH76 family n=1 Tax=Nostoc flagelliforme CCNUN1 TaxID=2038116 RepID=A0A2K8SXC2_9NOSO|nr:beta/gamma crystallin-related protein [Nostoc flagelliforme]AUB40082.1 putative alpha-1,6-mannanase, GH76 family [Nostoc flagelliforme CCNUN1]